MSDTSVAFNVVTGTNDDLNVNVDGSGATEITVSSGAYTGSELATAIAGQISGTTVDYGTSATDAFTITSTTSTLSATPSDSSVAVTAGTNDLGAGIGLGTPTEQNGYVTITDGSSDQFNINVDGTGDETVDIVTSNIVYSDADTLVTDLNAQLSGAAASWDTDHIVIKSGSSGLSSSVAVTPAGTNDATADIGYGNPTERTGDAVVANPNTGLTTEVTGGVELSTGDSIKYVDTGGTSGTFDTGEPVATDADGNTVYQDVFSQLKVSNTETSSPITDSEISGIQVWKDDGNGGLDTTADTEVTGVTPTYTSGVWTLNIANQDITSDTTFFVEIDVASGLTNDYTMTAQTSSMTTAGSESLSVTNSQTQTVDGNPAISSVETRDAGQPSGTNIGGTDSSTSTADNGQIDQLVVTFDEPITDSTVDTTDLSIDSGYSIDTITTGSASADDNTIVVDVIESGSADTGATPTLSVDAGNIEDSSGNTIAKGNTAATDGANPVVTSVSFSQSTITDSTTDQTVTATYSETMDTNTNPTVSFSNSISKSTASTAGWSNTNVADDTFERTFTVDDGQDATGVAATVDSAQDDSTSNNAQVSFTSSSTTFDVDRVNPTVTQTAITTTITTDSNSNTVANPEDTITVEWDDSSSGDNNADTISSVSVDLSAFGCGNSVSATQSSSIWTATCDVPSGTIDSTGLTASVTATDDDGNPTTQADDDTVSVDNEAPTISTAGDVDLSTDVDEDGIASIGDTLQYNAGTEGTGDVVSSWSVGLSTYNLGTLSAGNTKDIVSGSSDGAFSATETVTDDAGNTVTGQVTTSSFTNIDNTPPTVGNVIYTVTDSNGNSILNVGETIEVTADMSGVSDLAASSPVTVDLTRIGGSATQQMYDDGTNGDASSGDGEYTYTATVSETEIADTSADTYSPLVTATDDASNTDSNSGTAISESVDTNKPSLDSVSYSEGTDTADETLTLTFSEDIGTVGSPSDYTVTYTGSDGTFGDSNERTITPSQVSDGSGSNVVVTIPDQSQETDAGGNFRVTVANPGNVLDTAGNSVDTSQTSDSQTTSGTISSFDTNAPTVSTFTTIDRDTDGQVDAVNVDFSEPVQESTVEAGDFRVGSSNTVADSVALDAYGASDGSNSDLSKVQIQFTQDSNEISGTGVKNVDYSGTSSGSTTVKDTAGNTLADITDKTATDGANPVVTETVTKDSEPNGNIDRVQVKFSEAVNLNDAGSSDGIPGLSLDNSNMAIANKDYTSTSGSVTVNLQSDVTGTSATTGTSYSQNNGGIVDQNQNLELSTSVDQVTKTDGAAPVAISQNYQDVNSDAKIETVKVVYSEDITSGSFASGDWSFTTNPASLSVDSGQINTDTVNISVTGAPSDTTEIGTTDIEYTAGSSITDGSNDAGSSGALTLSDEADPVVGFSDGMNMVSFPSKVGVYDLGTLLDDSDNVNSGNVDAVWSYENGEWKSYDPDRSDSNNDFTNVEGGQGYILEASGSGKIVADVDQGDKAERGASGVELVSSQPWHLIGTYQESPTTSLADAGNDLSTSDVGQVLERDGSGSFTSVSNLNPGDGYWISVNSDRSYNPVFN